MNGGQFPPVAQAVQKTTINLRMFVAVKDLNGCCDRIEAVLHRIAPRPPQPEQPVGKLAGEGTPSMLEVTAMLENTAERLRRIAQEMPEIA